ncbi:asialoglycoprotein receptor 1-like isoform X2 [Aquarana catesbeiana]|uniref:asialoglycoprotein receptor 1-like isoform X2 n=1 Tax=Aquarana catesbeiana TaxID=8400 RepID=UPI003CC95E00
MRVKWTQDSQRGSLRSSSRRLVSRVSKSDSVSLIMSLKQEDFQNFQEDNTPKNRGNGFQGVIMKREIPRPSKALICSLSAVCNGLLFIIIILIVTITRQGVNQTEHNLEEKLRNLSIEMHSRLSQLYEDDSQMTEKLTTIESFIKDLRIARVITKVAESALMMKRYSSPEVLGSFSSDNQRILSAVGKMKAKMQKGNGTVDPLCGEDWIHHGFSCYFMSWNVRTWENAEAYCKNRKAHLVVINGVDEMNFLGNISHISGWWIGLRPFDGTWTWVDGTPYETTPKFWREGEMSSVYSSQVYGWEYCAHYGDRGEWESRICSWANPYICEKKIL